jgi:hypothetical protein
VSAARLPRGGRNTKLWRAERFFCCERRRLDIASTRTAALACVAALVVLGCLPAVYKGDRLLRDGRVDDAIRVLESAKQREPDVAVVALVLGSAYFRKAQDLFEVGDDDGYLRNLKEAQQEWLRALALDPKSHDAHNQLGILSTYRGDLESAEKTFGIGRQLQPVTHEFYLNLAEIEIYRGDLERGRRYLGVARKLGAPPGSVELVEVLAAWRRGDMVEAKDIFDGVMVVDPERARTWNGATTIASFRDMAEHCCRLRFCGPYMERACRGARIPMTVQVRDERGVEVLTEEAQLQRELNEGIRDVYERRDLGVRLNEDPDEALREIEIRVSEDEDQRDNPPPQTD